MDRPIVLALGVPELAAGGWRDPEICKKYPGSGYLPFLASYRRLLGSGEFSGDPKEALLVQEEMNPRGLELLEQGAGGSVLLCLETPLFAPLFYDALPELKKKFPFQFLYQGGTDSVFFPSYDPSGLVEPLPWAERVQKFCLVMSNKHWKPYEHLPGWKESKAWKSAIGAQLQDHRFLAIHDLQKQGLLDLYGKGWPLGMRAPEIPAGGKVDVMRRYALGLCIENTRMAGYVTEKLIDCLCAGVVPVYLGAPNIESFVPSKCFIPAESFEWPSADQAEQIIHAGQKFLRSRRGMEFTYRRFARRLLRRIVHSSESAPRPH